MRHFFSFDSRRFGWASGRVLLLLAIIGWLSASLLKPPANIDAQTPTSLRYDQIQQRFVHNAFGTVQDPVDESLTEQFIHYNIRGLELDLHPRQGQNAQPNHERDWFIFHVPLIDYHRSTVTRLTEALRMLQGFHNAQPQHEVITINLELGSGKSDKGNISDFSYGRSPEMLDSLLREYLGNWLYTPRDLLNNNPGATTLHAAVTPSAPGRGWPGSDRLRGKFIFFIHGDGLSGYDINLYFPGTQNGPPSAQDTATIYNRVCFLLDETAWKNNSPAALAFVYPHIVFHGQFGYAADAPKAKQMRQELPGHILRSAQVDDCNLQVCDGDTNRARFTESQKAGMNFLYMNMGSVNDPAFRTGNDQRYPFGSSLLEPDGNYSYNSPSYGVWMHPSVVNKAEPGSQLILGDKSGGDIDGQSDRFNFAMFPAVPPNGQTEQYVATIASASNTSIHSLAKGLLMARETTNANSRFFAVGRAGDNHGLIVMYRQQDGANAVYQEPSLGYKENYNIARLSLTPEIMNGKSGMRCRGYGSQSGYTWFQIGPSVWIEGNLGVKGMAVSANGGWDNGRTPPVFFSAPYSDYKQFEFVGLQFSFGNSPWQLFNLNPITLLGIGTGVNPNDSAAMRKLYYPCGENCVASTETSITAINPSPSALDQDVTVFFKVRTLSGTGLVPTGSVTVYSSDTSCTGTISGTAAGATGSCRLHYAQGGPVGIVANYQGDANYASSGSAVSSHYITRNLTTATLSSSANPIQFGQPLTLTAIVNGTAPGGLSPVGTVTFQLDDFLTADVPLVNGMATYVWQTPFLGLRTLKATYQGDGYFEPSEATINQQVNCATITLNPNTLVNGTALTPYNQPMTVTGLAANDRVFYLAGISYLPPGLMFDSSSGVISGTPEAVGSYSFGLGVADLGSNCRLERPYSMNITCPNITLATLPNAQLNAAYNQTAAATPASGDYAYAVVAGTLPPGLTLNPATGAVSGTPTQLGTFNFTIKATGFKAVTGPPDDFGDYTFVSGACNGSRAYTLTVGSTPVNNGLQFYPLSKPLRLLDT
ncbi:MAG TPA: Ca2+-dependent phosphoinositide-specific phospholipase C, partial [Blastocatellia bacterium]|nr:Ca2+-dependent phosphoinositide-specific phospholipase C [Blastocatellia bacterium]HNG33975.1 Ca2+-dependent phosphoinositide-specific phospholipase C [Blastocatellia bacterium]